MKSGYSCLSCFSLARASDFLGTEPWLNEGREETAGGSWKDKISTWILAWTRVQPNLERVFVITVVHIDCIEGWVPWLRRGPAIGQLGSKVVINVGIEFEFLLR